MGKLQSIIEESNASGFIFAGEFNAEPGKLFFNELLKVCDESHLIISDTCVLPRDTYTHINNASLKRSWLDRCVTSPCLHKALFDMYVDVNDTISDHLPMFLQPAQRRLYCFH